MVATAKGGNLILRRVRTPNTVKPGVPFEIAADVANGALIIRFDNDDCEQPSNPCSGEGVIGKKGYCIRVEYFVENKKVAEKGPTCIGIAEIGANDETYSVTRAIDTPGEYTIGARVVLPGTGEKTDTVATKVVVSEEGAKDAPEDGEDGDSFTEDVLDSITKNPVRSGVAVVAIGAGLSLVMN